MDKSVRLIFPGERRVDAEYKGFTIKTDQPVHQGGGGMAPAPFDLFLASLATCAGLYAQAFLTNRQLSTEGLALSLSTQVDPEAKMISKITIDVQLPSGFPEKYTKALIKAVDSCAVKKHILSPPEFEITTATS
jgi:putative redox protein